MSYLEISKFRKQSGNRNLFDNSNHKTIRGFYTYDLDDGNAIDVDGALRPSYPATTFASTTITDAEPRFLINNSTFTARLNASAIAMFLGKDRYLYDVETDGTIVRTGDPTPQDMFPVTITNGVTGVLHRGDLYLKSNDVATDTDRLHYPSSSGTGWLKSTGLVLERGLPYLLSYRDMVIIVPRVFVNASDGDYVEVQKMLATRKVVAGFKMTGPQEVKHVTSINSDYVVIISINKYAGFDQSILDVSPTDGMSVYLWNGEDSTWTRLLQLPYRGVIGSISTGSENWLFTYDDKWVYALVWDGNGYVEKTKTAFSFIKDEVAEMAYTDDTFVFLFKKQGLVVYWNLKNGETIEAQNLALTSGITGGFMSPEGEFIFLSATPDTEIPTQTGRIIRLEPFKQIPSNGTVTATPFFTAEDNYYESNILVPPAREDLRSNRLTINKFIVEGEKFDEIGTDDITIKLFGRDEDSTSYSELFSMTLTDTPVNTTVRDRLLMSDLIGRNVTSCYVTITYTRASDTHVWAGAINKVIVDYDIIEITT